MYCLNSSNIVAFLFVQHCCICIFVVANVLFGLLQNCWWQQAAAVNGSPKIPNKYQYFKNVHRKSLSLWKERSGWILWLPKLPPTFLSMHCSDNCYAFFLETEYSLLGRHILTFKVVFRICIIFMILSSSLCCYTFLVEKKYLWSLNCAKLLSAASVWNEWWGENIGNMIESFEAQHKQQPNFEMEEKQK